MKILSILLFLFAYTSGLAQIHYGQASFYAQKFEGRRTSNGEIYSGDHFTAAHRTLPFGTVLRITNQKNQKWVLVRVNDRGPFVANRIVDLSYRAAAHIDMVLDGVAHVSLEIMPDSTIIENFPEEAALVVPIDSLPTSGYGIQVLSISQTEHYMDDLRHLRHSHSQDIIHLQSKFINERRILRVILYHFENLAQAQNAMKLLGETYPGCFVVDFSFMK